jgi:Tfp pilus assembly ATPase PilU
MYSMDDLLEVVSAEEADELRLHVGTPPVIVLQGEDHVVEGPVITAENAEQLLTSMADTRQRREIQGCGATEFIFTFRDSSRFLVRAKNEEESVGLDLQRLAV